MRATCAAAALCYLAGQDSRVVQQFLDAFFLPMLARPGALPDRTCSLQACTGLAALLTAGRLHSQLRQLVDACFGALRSAGGGAGGAGLPLPVACTLLSAVVAELRGDGDSAGSELLAYVLSRLREALRAMLPSPAAPLRQAALKWLLPVALSCAQSCGGAHLSSLAQDLWRLALELLDAAPGGESASVAASGSAASGPVCSQQQRTALALLVSCCPLLQDPAAGVDVAGCDRFWEQLRGCLALTADVDSLERKRALLLLQRLAPADQMSRPAWALWNALYDILDEFPIHLVAPMWAKIDQLHPPAPEYRTETVVPKSYIPRKKELKSRKAASAAAAPGATGEADGEAGDGGAAALAGGGGDAWAVPMDWQVVLWTRALQHGNFQVQRLALRTLLQRDWGIGGSGNGGDEALRGVPPAFVAGVLLPSLTRDHHHRGGAAEANVVDAASASWLRAWFAAAPVAHRMEGLLALRSVVVGSDLSRLGLQQLMLGLAAGAEGAAADGRLLAAVTTAAAADGGGSAAIAAFPGALLASLRSVLVYLSNFTGMSFKRSVWQSALVIAAAAAPTAAAGVVGCLRLLAELPRGALEPGGELRGMARAWLLGRAVAPPPGEQQAAGGGSGSTADEALTAREAGDVVSWVRAMLEDFWAQQGGGSGAQPPAAAAAGAAATAQSIAQLLLMFDGVEAACGVVVQRLQQALYGMYGRPYLQAAEVDRALELLRELLAAVPPLPLAAQPFSQDKADRAPAAAGSALQTALQGLLVGVAEDLCSAASHAADAFLEATPVASAAGGGAAGPVVRRLAGALLSLLARLAASPLPARRRAAVVAGLRAATSAAEALRHAAVWNAQVRAMAAERLDASALAAAALREAAAAAASATASGRDGGGDAAQGASLGLAEVEAAKWPLLDAATAWAAELPGPPPQGARAGGAAAAATMTTAGSLRLQRGVLCEVLAQSVSALSEYPEGQVLPLLRCLRRCWAEVATGGAELQATAAAAMGADTAADGTGAPPLASLSWPVVRALWNALCATPRRTAPLCAAFVNTALLPGLYVQQSGPLLTALHGSDGPCRWLLSRLLDWGGTSSRFLLLAACQLGSFLPLQPGLLGCYAREVQGLLLWGSKRGAAYDHDSMEGAEGVAAEELAAVAAPPDPALTSSAAVGSEVGPRVALLCCLHRMAEIAGCVWPPPATGAAPSAAEAAAAAPAAVPAADAEAGPAAGPKRPVIIFGDSSAWDEPSSAAPAAAGASTDSAGASGRHPGPGALPALASAVAPGAGNGAAEGEGPEPDYGAPPPPDPSHPALLAGRALWRQLLAVALNDPLLSTDKVRNGSELHRQKVRLWQSLVVLSSFVPREEAGAAVASVLAQINGNNPPTVKQYVEAVVAALVLREPSLLQSQLLPLISSYGRHLSGLGSYILIAAQVLLHSPPSVQAHSLRPLLLALSPWLMCHGHGVRTYAQLVMWSLLHRFPPEDPMWRHSVGDLGYLRQMLQFMRTNVDLVRLRKNIGDPILDWHPAGIAHPARVFASGPGSVCLAGSPHELAAFEGAPATLVDRIQGFLVAERHRLRDELSDRAAEREFAPQDPNGPAASSSGAGAAAAGGGGEGVGDFQRKITPEALLAALEGSAASAAGRGGDAAGGGLAEGAGGLAAILEGDEEEDWKVASGSRRLRHDVLLVASLIDKLPNLAGLARSCEVLGAGRLVLGDMAATKDPLFTSVSVTAEQWLPMEEVKPAALLAWLEQRAAEGYTLVGLEQTAESVRLPDYRWPSKVVLVLGREKEGIPPEVLSLLDATLEIPQRGIIRSLNVHVSGAIALYEYVRQMQA
ncbi:hypothetical protein GPECTOR_74g709 [Gonium pectorale]|uniref:tRNA/rRNA methyltransferase SpoU type domain-containing protein n=1 Tax=Gonium pectorale TaxID=33097 RepID=A0A150G3L7_GONPE|nr:hypothetical protein GPECTOR_74g709 [Gonium pectorale]|eukprot:KXZ44095.1 hypothetical protein GPECTOR_74g709 [Gonium pectorale]